MKRISPRILLIDDNEHGMVARRAALEERGFQVATASCGASGLDAFHAGPFDLVVTDYRMPGLGGKQVLAGIRAADGPRVPVIVLSGYSDTLGLREELPEADAVLTKGPSELDDLLRVIGRLIKPSAASKRAAASAGADATTALDSKKRLA